MSLVHCHTHLSRAAKLLSRAAKLHVSCVNSAAQCSQADPGLLPPAAGSKGPALVVLQADAEGPKSYDGAFESADLAAWVEKAAAPAIVTLDQ